MGQVEENLDALADDVMTFVAANIYDKSNSAGIVLLRRVVQTLGGRRSIRFVATRRHGHVCSIGIVSGTGPLSDELFLSGNFLRQGCRGGTSAQERTAATYYLEPSARQSTIQNFDAKDAKL
jgi:hypothetical protein